MNTIINLEHDGYMLRQLLPTIGKVRSGIVFAVESALSKDEELYTKEYGAVLVHSERDRIVDDITEYMLKPVKRVMGTTYVYRHTPESLSAITEAMSNTLNANEIANKASVDFETIQLTYTVIGEKGEPVEETISADELFISSLLEVLEIKLTAVYKEFIRDFIGRVETNLQLKQSFVKPE